MPPSFHKVRISSKEFLTEDAAEFTFSIPEEVQPEFMFLAGQYLTFKCQIQGEEVRRSYSLCSSPGERLWKVGIKRVEHGVFSNYALDELQVGDFVDVMTPMGNFQYNPAPLEAKNIVLFAAGSGITPILSIAKTVLSEEVNSSVTLFFGNKGFSSIMFIEELENLKNKYLTRFRVIHLFSQESQGIPLQMGRINEEKLPLLHKAFLSHDAIDGIYVCGPEAMILAVKSYFEQTGLPKSAIHFELFLSGLAKTTTQEKVKMASASCRVSLIIDDDQLVFDMMETDNNLLDAAQKAGADVPYACKGGVCCTCKAKILEGSAQMRVNYALEAEEVEQGYVLTCQAVPTSSAITISFDE